MNGNRFYVHPAGDLTQGLQGLGQAIQGLGEQRKVQAEKERIEQIKQGALEAFQSGDPDKIAEYALQNPEIAEMLMTMGKFRSERTKQNFLDTAYSIIAEHEAGKTGTKSDTDEDEFWNVPPVEMPEPKFEGESTPPVPMPEPNLKGLITDPFYDVPAVEMPEPPRFKHIYTKPTDRIRALADARQAFLRSQGQTDEDMPFTSSFMQKYQKNPEQAINELKMDVAGLDPERWKKFSSAFGETGKAFTLSPGQVRYGPNGEVIVRGETKPEEPWFKDISDNELTAIAQDMRNPNQAKAQAILNAKNKKIEDPFKDVSDNELWAMSQDPNNPNRERAQRILDAKGEVRNKLLEQDQYEALADEVEAGRNTLSNIASGSRGAIIRANVSAILAKRGVDVVSLEANRKSKETALRALEKTVNQLKPFEETARKNLSYAMDLSHQYVRTRYPSINKLKKAWDEQTGDPKIEQFKVATYTGILEAMKHNTAGSGVSAAELSVRAQERADEMLNTVKSWEQFDSIVDALNVDMTNRAESYADQLIKLKEMPLNEYMAYNKNKTKKAPPTITTQEEYDELPSGSVFIENGQKYRKP